MIRKIVPHIILLNILFHFLSISLASEQNWKPAQDGNKIIFIRHSLAPGRADPPGFKLNDCSTQRNLNQIGINQSKKIGKLFTKKKLRLIKYYLVNGVGARIQLDMHLEISRNFQL